MQKYNKLFHNLVQWGCKKTFLPLKNLLKSNTKKSWTSRFLTTFFYNQDITKKDILTPKFYPTSLLFVFEICSSLKKIVNLQPDHIVFAQSIIIFSYGWLSKEITFCLLLEKLVLNAFFKDFWDQNLIKNQLWYSKIIEYIS